MALTDNISVLKPAHRGVAQFQPPVRMARVRRRHIAAILSFFLLILLPVASSAWYLWMRAADQYASTLAFSIRSEEASSGIELLGGIADISGSGANDSDILYDYLGSQQLVADIEAALGLSDLWSQPDRDPVFAYDPSGRIEDLHDHWARMIDISHDSTRGIIEVRARAFSARSAQDINRAILEKSNHLINNINNIAHEDGIRYALDDLQRAKVRLGSARRALTEFRIVNEIVDPSVDMSSQTSLLATLDAQLTEALIDIEMLSANTRRSDTRIAQARQKAGVLRQRIAQERAKRGSGTTGADHAGMAEIYGAYEGYMLEVEFTEQSYQAARANFDAAVSEARRNTRYLAAHIMPTLAQQSLFPQRVMILSAIALACFLLWSLIALVGFSFLDRR